MSRHQAAILILVLLIHICTSAFFEYRRDEHLKFEREYKETLASKYNRAAEACER